jgi:hypothetical protein
VRRLIRILGRVGVGVSLLLFVGVVGLWVRSYWKSDSWARFGYVAKSHEYRQEFIQSERGRAAVSDWSVVMDDQTVSQMEELAAKGHFDYQWRRTQWGLWWPEQRRWWENLLFVRVQKNAKNAVAMGVGSGLNVIVPYWILTVLFLIYPAMRSVRWWRTSRSGPGLCRKCGYDLRASSERCPECGVVVIAGEVRN